MDLNRLTIDAARSAIQSRTLTSMALVEALRRVRPLMLTLPAAAATLKTLLW